MTTVRPSLDEVLAHEGDETHVALAATLVVDGLSPVALFRGLAADRPGAFLLESVEGGELMGRYSFLGFDAPRRFSYADGVLERREGGRTERIPTDRPLEALRAALTGHRVWSAPDLPRFQGGLVGYLGFDLFAGTEPIPLPDGAGVEVPQASLLFTEDVVVYDHAGHRAILIAHAALDGDRASAYREAQARLQSLAARIRSLSPRLEPWALAPAELPADRVRANRSAADFEGAVRAAKAAIEDGEIFQVVLSQRFSVEARVDPFELYRTLRALNPSPYMFYVAFEGFSLVGASPEVLVRREAGDLFVRPIAGTRRRGRTPEEDAALEADLLSDEKELAEHRMLLDLGRDDLGHLAVPGTVRVERPLHVERYAHVMHIVSDVHARCAPGKDAFDVLAACFPAGTVCGAPKIRAAELIARLEPDRRGPYAGAVGYFDFRGNLDTCIAIRTMVVEPEQVHLQAGAGIVFDSVPEREREECWNKARSGLTAIALTEARARGDES